MFTKKSLLYIALCVLAIFGGYQASNYLLSTDALKVGSTKTPDIDGLFWPRQKELKAFSLTAHDLSAFDLESVKDKWSILFFGYTHCPDICPVTMSTLRQAQAAIIANGLPPEQLQIIFISVDPERDTPSLLADYINYFGDGFSAATGNIKQLDSITKQLGVPYFIAAHQAQDKNYLVDHSAALFVISPHARLAALFRAPHQAQEIAQRFIAIEKLMSDDST